MFDYLWTLEDWLSRRFLQKSLTWSIYQGERERERGALFARISIKTWLLLLNLSNDLSTFFISRWGGSFLSAVAPCLTPGELLFTWSVYCPGPGGPSCCFSYEWLPYLKKKTVGSGGRGRSASPSEGEMRSHIKNTHKVSSFRL